MWYKLQYEQATENQAVIYNVKKIHIHNEYKNSHNKFLTHKSNITKVWAEKHSDHVTTLPW